MTFSLTFKSGSRMFYMTCQRIQEGETTEQYKLWATNNPGKYVILQNNRPLLRNKLNLKYKKLAWKVVEGKVQSKHTLEKVIEMIEGNIDR